MRCLDQFLCCFRIEFPQAIDGLDDLVLVVERVMLHSQFEQGMGVHRLQFRGALEIVDGLFALTQCSMGYATAKPCPVNGGIDAQGSIESFDGFEVRMLLLLNKAKIEQGVGVIRGVAQHRLKLLDCEVESVGFTVEYSEGIFCRDVGWINGQHRFKSFRCARTLIEENEKTRTLTMPPVVMIH